MPKPAAAHSRAPSPRGAAPALTGAIREVPPNPTAYDAVAYPGAPFSQTHPDRLATLASLYGLTPAPPGRCRLLELGCGEGGNLVPMAHALPGSEFLGVDLVARAPEGDDGDAS